MPRSTPRARRCRRGCGSGRPSARITSTPAPAERRAPLTIVPVRSAMRRGRLRMAGGLVAAAVAGAPAAGQAQTVEDLRGFSIDQLANIQISSVSKSEGPLSDAPAAIYVISHDDIIRSGATT